MSVFTKPPGLRPSIHLTAVLKLDGHDDVVARVLGIDSTYVRVSTPNLPIPRNTALELQLFDDALRMNMEVIVEDSDPFGFTGRFVQSSEIFKYWIALIDQ